MRVLFWHCDYFKYWCNKETKVAESATDSELRAEIKDVLSLMTCIERTDEGREEEIVKNLIADLTDYTRKISCNRILIYPYAHLSKNLASPRIAISLIGKITDACKNAGLEVYKSPFGWEKGFEVRNKGHPLAESYREY